jgi:SMC interacting uncharacterized protein involved in chromosome segregation
MIRPLVNGTFDLGGFMDQLDRRILLLETLRKLDYQIIEKKQSEPEAVHKLKQEREELRSELNTLAPKMVA